MDFAGARYHRSSVNSFYCKNTKKLIRNNFKSCKSVIIFKIASSDGEERIYTDQLIRYRPHDDFCEFSSTNSILKSKCNNIITYKGNDVNQVDDEKVNSNDQVTDYWLDNNLDKLKSALNNLIECSIGNKSKFKNSFEDCKRKFDLLSNNFNAFKDQPVEQGLSDEDKLKLMRATEELKKMFKKISNDFIMGGVSSSKSHAASSKSTAFKSTSGSSNGKRSVPFVNQQASNGLKSLNRPTKNFPIKVTKDDKVNLDEKEVSRAEMNGYDLAEMNDGSFVVYC